VTIRSAVTLVAGLVLLHHTLLPDEHRPRLFAARAPLAGTASGTARHLLAGGNSQQRQIKLASRAASEGNLVHVDFKLTRDDDGTLVATSKDSGVDFLAGMGMVPSALDDAVKGMEVGQSKKVALKEGLGMQQVTSQISTFWLPEGTDVGTELVVEQPSGTTQAVVQSIKGITATLANHPWAGLPLTMDVTVSSIKEAQKGVKSFTATTWEDFCEPFLGYMGSRGAAQGAVFDPDVDLLNIKIKA
jgi:FKBP-type peptidyl-prolyl cis-trans isomerase 2